MHQKNPLLNCHVYPLLSRNLSQDSRLPRKDLEVIPIENSGTDFLGKHIQDCALKDDIYIHTFIHIFH